MDECVTEAACSHLLRRKGEGDGRPFAAVVGYLLPHCPFIGPRELFDLREDPDELHDLGQSAAHAAIREELMHLLTENWDPGWVRDEAAENRAGFDYISRWAQKVRPQSPYMVPMPPPQFDRNVELM